MFDYHRVTSSIYHDISTKKHIKGGYKLLHIIYLQNSTDKYLIKWWYHIYHKPQVQSQLLPAWQHSSHPSARALWGSDGALGEFRHQSQLMAVENAKLLRRLQTYARINLDHPKMRFAKETNGWNREFISNSYPPGFFNQKLTVGWCCCIVGCPSPSKFGTSSLRCCHPISRFHHKGHPRFTLGLKRGDFTTAALLVRQLTLTTATEGLNTKNKWNHQASHLKHRKEGLLVLKHYKFRGNHISFMCTFKVPLGRMMRFWWILGQFFWVCGCHISYWCPSEYWI